MAIDSGVQRIYRAPCPGCGAPVEFRSAQSTHAVCAYCQSTVVRGEGPLLRLGKMAELFDDFSPLQLLATGRTAAGGFIIVGRLQYAYEGGRWTEWIIANDDGRLGVLSEDNGAYVIAAPVELDRTPPPASQLRVGATTAFAGVSWVVSSTQQVRLVSAQGELPKLPPLGMPVDVVELRNEQGEVLSLEYLPAAPTAAWQGRSVPLQELGLRGLRDEVAKDETGRQFDCPNCGAPVRVELSSSKSTTCPSCRSIIDLESGVGGAMRHASQDEPIRPQIPLGTTGELRGATWQVVGFQHRMGRVSGDDESFGWDEYLLYNRTRGFCMLVDAQDGWSLVAPITGVPKMARGSGHASYLGKTYKLKESYQAETTYVAGEFYWKVERGQRTSNSDFADGNSLLSLERSNTEQTWSAGTRIDAAVIAKIFKRPDIAQAVRRGEAAPLSAIAGMGLGTVVLVVVLVLVLLLLFFLWTEPSRGYGRSSGGAFGGYSSGGGHK